MNPVLQVPNAMLERAFSAESVSGSGGYWSSLLHRSALSLAIVLDWAQRFGSYSGVALPFRC